MRYLTCDPRAETLGANILAYMENLREFHSSSILRRHGLANLEPNQWVSTQKFLDALNEMWQKSDFMSMLVAVGMSVGELVPMPQAHPDLAEALNTWNDLYQRLHRNADVGQIKCERENATHFKLTFTDLYPDDFSYGMMYGYAKRFLPPGTQFSIYYDPKVTPRDRGGRDGCTVIHARWQ